MKRSSSQSDAEPPADPPGLFDEVLARGAVRAAVADRAWLAALLDAEAALARAQSTLGLVPESAASAISAACAPERIDLDALAAASAGPGNPVRPLVDMIRAAVPEHAEYVHLGTTTQDILDTAAMLVAFRAVGALLADLTDCADAAADLAREYRDSAMAGRTLLQLAMPVTFGLKAASWLVALDEATDRLAAVRADRLAVQLGGAVGTLDGLGRAALELPEQYAAQLGLAVPLLPWHTDRTRVADLTGALAAVAGVVGKIARDVTLLAQNEVGEVTETGQPQRAGAADGAQLQAPSDRGRSSAMAHKRNPIAAIAAVACAAQAPGLCATLYAAMVQEHERAAGAWHAEWRPLRELLASAGSAAAWLRDSLTGLTVDRRALAANLRRLSDVAGLADPPARLGAAGELVDRALAAHAIRKGDVS